MGPHGSAGVAQLFFVPSFSSSHTSQHFVCRVPSARIALLVHLPLFLCPVGFLGIALIDNDVAHESAVMVCPQIDPGATRLYRSHHRPVGVTHVQASGSCPIFEPVMLPLRLCRPFSLRLLHCHRQMQLIVSRFCPLTVSQACVLMTGAELVLHSAVVLQYERLSGWNHDERLLWNW